MPWTTLGLDPAGATERDVKRAYAKRLKTCRPDQDPEGFRKLHDAYHAALLQLQWRSYDDGEDEVDEAGEIQQSTIPIEIAQEMPIEELRPSDRVPVASESSSDDTLWAATGTFDPSPGSRAITDCFDRLEAAFASGAGNIPALVEQAETLLYEHPSEVLRWSELMREVFGRHGDDSGLVLKADTILFELEHGGSSATLAVIERLDRKGNSNGIANLANVLLQNKARIPTSAAGIVAARLAGAAAFWARGRTERLSDFAYEHLARGERDFHMRLIDRHVAMASMLALVPVHLKSFWRQRLMQTAGRDNWDDEESVAAIAWLKTPMARRGPCFETLVGLLPEELAVSVKATSNKLRASEWVPPVAPQRKKWFRSTGSSSSSGGGLGWGSLIPLILLLRAVATCANSSSYSSPPPPRLNLPPSSLEQFDPETQRRIKEGAEKLREYREKRERQERGIPETIVPPLESPPKPGPPKPPENP